MNNNISNIRIIRAMQKMRREEFTFDSDAEKEAQQRGYIKMNWWPASHWVITEEGQAFIEENTTEE